MREKQKVIEYHLNGKTERQIRDLTGHSRNTIRKYTREFKKSREEDVRELPITESILEKPTYKKRQGKKKVLTPEIEQVLKRFIRENERKRNHYMSKQQMKIVDMHEALIDRGFQIGYTTVRHFVNRETGKAKETFIRKYMEPGYEVEFDWGEVKLVIDGHTKRLSLAVFTLPYSNYRVAKLYESETQICVLDVHSHFLHQVGFIPSVFVYDNMRTVVKSFIGDEREIHEEMKNLSNYYGFSIRLCGPGKGNEKGSVERSVEFIRRKAFSEAIHYPSIEEAAEHLARTLHKLNNRNHYAKDKAHRELMTEEKEQSTPMIAFYDPSELIECRVDKYSTIVIKQNHYSVPEGHVGKFIKVKVGAEKIRLFIDGDYVSEHKRNWGVHQWVMDINHYLDTFKMKRGALPQSESLRQAPKQIKNIYNHYYIGKERDFIDLLSYIKENKKLDRVMEVIEELQSLRGENITTEQIIFMCQQSPSSGDSPHKSDDITGQARANIKALEELFMLSEEGAQ
ncbi:IS21 family transposase [Alkalibacillus silvisoli]|uniref:IS21 family transposase n=1 Tax=Alkalibacillus silvisoli TaxID=392823 RepID=UPI003CD09B16